jgi:hypothetical protein
LPGQGTGRHLVAEKRGHLRPPPPAVPDAFDWKALSKRIGHADVAFTMKQYVQTDLEADRQVANTLAELIIGGTLVSAEITDEADRGGDEAA